MVDNAAKPTRYLKLKITNILNIIRWMIASTRTKKAKNIKIFPKIDNKSLFLSFKFFSDKIKIPIVYPKTIKLCEKKEIMPSGGIPNSDANAKNKNKQILLFFFKTIFEKKINEVKYNKMVIDSM